MKNKFLEKATAHITPEERALMVKSLAIISQIHDEILDRKDISQKGQRLKFNMSDLDSWREVMLFFASIDFEIFDYGKEYNNGSEYYYIDLLK